MSCVPRLLCAFTMFGNTDINPIEIGNYVRDKNSEYYGEISAIDPVSNDATIMLDSYGEIILPAQLLVRLEGKTLDNLVSTKRETWIIDGEIINYDGHVELYLMRKQGNIKDKYIGKDKVNVETLKLYNEFYWKLDTQEAGYFCGMVALDGKQDFGIFEIIEGKCLFDLLDDIKINKELARMVLYGVEKIFEIIKKYGYNHGNIHARQFVWNNLKNKLVLISVNGFEKGAWTEKSNFVRYFNTIIRGHGYQLNG